MPTSIDIQLEMPDDLARLHLPEGLQRRLRELLDKQDSGVELLSSERMEAEGITDLADLLSLLRMRAERGAADN